jgi:prophage regulatory protein
MDRQDKLKRLLSIREVEKYAGRKKTQIVAAMNRGEFPKPLRLGPKTIRWLEEEILAWQREQIAARDHRRDAA